MAHFKKSAQPPRRQNTTYKPPFPRGRKVCVKCNIYVFKIFVIIAEIMRRGLITRIVHSILHG